MAEGAGEGEAPGISIRWYNLETGEIETSSVPGFSFSIIAPPPEPAPPDYRKIARKVLLVVAVALILFSVARRYWPFARAVLSRWQTKRRASETWAFDQLRARGSGA